MLHDEFGASWGEIATLWRVSKATAWRVANTDYAPKREDIRERLRLPELITIEARRDEKGRFT